MNRRPLGLVPMFLVSFIPLLLISGVSSSQEEARVVSDSPRGVLLMLSEKLSNEDPSNLPQGFLESLDSSLELDDPSSQAEAISSMRISVLENSLGSVDATATILALLDLAFGKIDPALSGPFYEAPSVSISCSSASSILIASNPVIESKILLREQNPAYFGEVCASDCRLVTVVFALAADGTSILATNSSIHDVSESEEVSGLVEVQMNVEVERTHFLRPSLPVGLLTEVLLVKSEGESAIIQAHAAKYRDFTLLDRNRKQDPNVAFADIRNRLRQRACIAETLSGKDDADLKFGTSRNGTIAYLNGGSLAFLGEEESTNLDSVSVATNFLEEYEDAFGISSFNRNLALSRVKKLPDGGKRVEFIQPGFRAHCHVI